MPTIAEMLRPVGEVTMWNGALADIPEGWLPLTGGTFDPATYPALAAHLGGSTLPDMTDVFPIGAGAKAVGSSGGSPTKVIATENLPSISVRYAADAQTGGTATRVLNVGGATPAGGQTLASFGGEEPLDVMPPWRAVYFMIRAV